MSRLVVAPIVEGHGEQEAVRVLLDRLWRELSGGGYLEVVRPIRRPRNQLAQEEHLLKAIGLARLKLRARLSSEDVGFVLVLVDADKDLPCRLGPKLQTYASGADLDISCVVANVEYETWFVAAAESLTQYLDITDRVVPTDPESEHCGKGWIGRRIKTPKYSETVDQPKLTAAMDLELCRKRSPSFDKLCRELEKRLPSPE